MKEKVKKFKAWFTSNLPLDEIGEKLKRSNVIKNFEYDYENVYEWLETEADENNFRFNFSRQHCDFEDFGDQPITFLIVYNEAEPSDEIVADNARRIARTLGCKVSLGFIHHICDDDFEYEVMSQISKPESD